MVELIILGIFIAVIIGLMFRKVGDQSMTYTQSVKFNYANIYDILILYYFNSYYFVRFLLAFVGILMFDLNRNV